MTSRWPPLILSSVVDEKKKKTTSVIFIGNPSAGGWIQIIFREGGDVLCRAGAAVLSAAPGRTQLRPTPSDIINIPAAERLERCGGGGEGGGVSKINEMRALDVSARPWGEITRRRR